MGKRLSREQRRLALFTVMDLQGMKELVQLFGLNSKQSKSAQIIYRNVKKFLERARLTENAKGRACDDKRLSTSTMLAVIVSSPSRKETVSNCQLVKRLGVLAGSSSRLAGAATKNRVKAREGNYSNFLGPSNPQTKTRKLSVDEWNELREDYIPNLECVLHDQ